MLLTSTGRHSASSEMPPFPGAQQTLLTRGDCRNFQTSACSRPPLPITRTFIARDRQVRGSRKVCQTLKGVVSYHNENVPVFSTIEMSPGCGSCCARISVFEA